MATPFGYTGNLQTLRRGVKRLAATPLGRMTMQAAGNMIGAGSLIGTGVLGLAGGLQAGADAMRFGFPDPAAQGLHTMQTRDSQYALGWMCYSNEIFEQINFVQSKLLGLNPVYSQFIGPQNIIAIRIYLAQRNLYARTMPLYNPTRRLVDFYASNVFPGVLSEDGAQLPDGMRIAIPLSQDTPPELKSAIAQGWAWGNWQRQKAIWIRFCASCGDGPVEIVDDVEAGIVYAEPVWPGEITHIELDGPGNVKAYTRVHRTIGEDGRAFALARVVNADTISTFRDGEAYSVNGLPAVYDNPYGFAPLIWNSHIDFKTIPGGTAVRNWNKVEKLNSLASRVHRYVERQCKTPMFLPGATDVERVKLDATAEEELSIITSTSSGAPVTMEGNLDLDAAEVRILSLITEIEHDHPEVVMYNALRGMSQVTGPAAEALMGDVAGYLTDARAGYDQGEIRKNGMLVAIGGMRYAEGKGGWSNKTAQQRKFSRFGLESYSRGELEHSIDARPIMAASRMEEAQTKMTVAAAYSAMESAGKPLEYQLEHDEGWDAAQLAELEKSQDDAFTRALDQQKAAQPPAAPDAPAALPANQGRAEVAASKLADMPGD